MYLFRGGSCSVPLESELLSDTYEWYIKSWNEFGKVWSDGMGFTVSGINGSSLVGTRRSTDSKDDLLLFSFFNDGTYIHAEVDFNDPYEKSGMEWGTYSRDEKTGEMTVTQTFDDNGDTGLTDFTGKHGLFMNISDNTLILTWTMMKMVI